MLLVICKVLFVKVLISSLVNLLLKIKFINKKNFCSLINIYFILVGNETNEAIESI